MKKVLKSLVIVGLIVFVVTLISSTSFATVYDSVKMTGTLSSGAASAKTSVTKITSAVLTTIRYAGSGIALIMLTIIFIKYILSAASERAEIKKNLIPYTIGAVVLFAASNLVSILQNVANQLFPDGTAAAD